MRTRKGEVPRVAPALHGVEGREEGKLLLAHVHVVGGQHAVREDVAREVHYGTTEVSLASWM